MTIQDVLKELTLEEKAALVEGFRFWYTNAIPRLNIPSICLTDGPHGVRKKVEGSDSLSLDRSYPATSFPTAVNVANSWDESLAYRMGQAIAEECLHYGVHVLLGPGLNIKRNPLCGRNFEYYSEDPLLAGVLAGHFIKGVEEKGIAATPKHFALNNSENYRLMGNSVADERAMREIYLKAFEIAIRIGKPRAIMCAYNQVNGVFCSENRYLMTDILRNEWGFDGLVMTDWGATHDRLKGLEAGIDLDMPGGIWHNRKQIIEGVRNGSLDIKILDQAVLRVLKLIEGVKDLPREEADFDAHHNLALEIALDSAVLLKNEGLLPLRGERLFIVGELFERMRYQGAGSSVIHPTKLVSPKKAFDDHGVSYDYVKGYSVDTDAVDSDLLEEALQRASAYETVVIFAGLTESYESEGFDRSHMRLPENQVTLIERFIEQGKAIVLVLFGGSPVELPFVDGVKSILHMYLPGQAGGEAARRLLFGEHNPSGRLSETWMKSYEEVPFGSAFSKTPVEYYKENVYVGYRYYDLKPEAILFPFGYGLSYTQFEYDRFQVKRKQDEVIVTLEVTNVGPMDGQEVIQLYVYNNDDSDVFKPVKELKAFKKVFVPKGETRTVELSFSIRDLAYYHKKVKRWVLENGIYKVGIGKNSRDILYVTPVTVEGEPYIKGPYEQSVVNRYRAIAFEGIDEATFIKTIDGRIPPIQQNRNITMETRLAEYESRFFGRLILKMFDYYVKREMKKVQRLPEGPERETRYRNTRFLGHMIRNSSARSLVMSSGGFFSYMFGEALVHIANGRLLKGFKNLLKREKPLPLPCERPLESKGRKERAEEAVNAMSQQDEPTSEENQTD